jgi:hypothetical protein
VRILAILTVRNEAAFLLEWLAHHRAVGVTDFLVFSNACQDGTDAMLDHLQDKGLLTHVQNEGPYDKRGIQFTALNRAQSHPLVQAADWIVALDIDEFINVHTGDHTMPALIKALPDATAITLTWRLFGNNTVVRYADTPVTRTFTACAPRIVHWPWRAAMFKTLYRNDGIYAKPGVHRPRAPDHARLDQARWFDGSGRRLGPAFATKRIFSDYGQDNHALVQLNHYPLGAMESFVLKADRGRAVHDQDMLGLDYWIERNFNTETDTSVHAIEDAKLDELAQLMADTALATCHAEAVNWRKARFDALLQLEPFRALFGRLLMSAPSRPVSARAAQVLISAARAQSDKDE